MSPSHPQLRAVSIKPFRHQGQAYYLLEDPLNLGGRGHLLVPRAAGPFLALMDGTRSLEELEKDARREYGLKCEKGSAASVVKSLEENFYLEGPVYQARLAQVREAYRQAPYRPASCAGGVYEENPQLLKKSLDGDLSKAKTLAGDFPGVLSPHIDYARGAPVYAEAWKAVEESARAAERVIIFGTDHYFGAQPFTLTRQSYHTPYGVLPTNLEIVDQLAEVLGPGAFEGELTHLAEHSIELAAVWLHHIREGRAVELIPVLTGGSALSEDGFQPSVQAALTLLKETAQEKKTLVVAAGDLSHVGPAFGGPALLAEHKEELRRLDATFMVFLEKGQVQNFVNAVEGPGNPSNVCGTFPLAFTLSLLDKPEGRQLGYAQCPADETGTSVVSVGAMVFG